MLCPTCDNTQLVMSDRQGLEIDYCPKCRGVWLDRGELDKIIERATAEAQNANPPQAGRGYDNHSGHGGGHGYDSRGGHGNSKHGYGYRKKSIWSEIFD